MSRSLHFTSLRRSRGFTLVEMLVVVVIIVILMAILIPVTMRAIVSARNAAIAVELRELKVGVEEYKSKHGDYPPSMGGPVAQWLPANRYSTVCEKHLLRCYPKMTPVQKDFFYNYIAWQLDNDEVLVFWLALIADDPREPFKNFNLDAGNNLIFTPTPGSPAGTVGVYPGPYTRHVHFEFKEERVFDGNDGDPIPAYRSLYARDTTYIYFDSRTYRMHMTPGTAALATATVNGVCQPFNDAAKVQQTLTSPQPPDSTFVNPNTFQIHSAGQDGNFGGLVTAVDNNFNWLNNWQNLVKTFPTMLNTNEEDSDNLADFTEGRTLIDHRP